MLELSGSAEQQIVAGWLDRHRPEDTTDADFWISRLPQTRRRANRRGQDPRLDAFLATDSDPLLIPMRIIWLPAERHGERAVGLTDVLTPGDPRDPDPIRQHVVLRIHPERVRIIMGEPGRASDVRKAWNDPDGRPRHEGQGLAPYVAQRAWLALERAERSVRGNRYKVPHFPRESLTERRSFTRGVADLARSEGKSYKQMAFTTRRYVREIAATHTPYVIDIVAGSVKWLIGRAYVKIQYDREELKALYAISQQYPVVFLPSHKSNFDHLVLMYVLYQNGLPPNHTAGGDNVNFIPVGTFLRRSGVFFIRREFKDNAPYKFVLRQYIDYLLEKRFPIEWFIEGGRSRSGKLRAPRYGLLSYVVASYQRGSADDVVFIPVSIAYDQIQEVGGYAAETTGTKAKEAESFGWMMRSILGLHHRYGEIHLRFGAPIALKAFLNDLDVDTAEAGESRNPAIPKLAFEVATRINEVTPITPVAIVSFAILNSPERVFTFDELIELLLPYRRDIQERALPVTVRAKEADDEMVRNVIDELTAHDLITRVDDEGGPHYTITDDQIPSAAYYRNSIVHFYVTIAITEVALSFARDVDTDRLDRAIVAETLRLRDLLKFEFFFSPSAEFVEEVRHELSRRFPEWRKLARSGEVGAILERFSPLVARGAIGPFIDSYLFVAEALVDLADDSAEPAQVSEAALAAANAALEAGTLTSADSRSSVIFGSALQLAANRGLLEAAPGVGQRRRELRDEIAAVAKRIRDLNRTGSDARPEYQPGGESVAGD
jgi:glycerol-3-phosphate O-acyltransferase